MKPVIVIPIFDEAATVGLVVERARAHAPVLVVDDGSRDGGAAVAEAAGAEVLRHQRRLGKAQALLTGIAAARRRGATAVITLDGDGQHDPAAIPALLAVARATARTVVVGNRLGGRGPLPVDRRNAVRVASFFASWLCGSTIPDSQSGFRVYPLAVFEEVTTRRGGFVFETEILLAAAAAGYGIEPVSVPALPRRAERSRFRPVRDGAAIATFLAGRTLLRWTQEAGALVSRVVGAFHPDRLATRHAEMLEVAAGSADSPLRWSLAIGVAAGRRAGLRLRAAWDDARRRGMNRAALATLAAPLTLPLLVLAALVGDRLPDVLSPLVDAVYGTPRPEPFDLGDVAVGVDVMTESGG